MPLWTIYHPPTTFTNAVEKSALATAITSVYVASRLPAFYVVVQYIALPPSDSYNIARKLESKKNADRFLGLVDEALKPHIADKGYDWEYGVLETSRDLWKTQGLVPPMPGTEAEKEWIRVDRAVLFAAADGGLVARL